MRFSTLNAWLNWLEQLHPVEIDLGLDRVLAVAKHLNVLSFSATVITVAGTNGKGSTVAALQALLSQPHLNKPSPRVATYTSPHLISFTERITLDANPVDEAVLCRALESVDQARLATNVSLSYFEFTTLAALVIFAQAPLDYILLEVGLGGRLDAVNVVDADVAVITQIAIDHESWLGSNREVIAVEKAGILRANQMAVIADSQPPISLQDRVKALGCQVRWAHNTVAESNAACHGFVSGDESCEWQGVAVDGSVTALAMTTSADLPPFKLALASWSAAMQAALMLNALPSAEVCKALIASEQLAGRLSIVQHNDRVILLDVAHNTQSVERLADFLGEHGQSDELLDQEKPLAQNKPLAQKKPLAQNKPLAHNWVAIFAVMADKDIGAMLDCTMPLIKKWYLPALQNCPRAESPEQLLSLLKGRQLAIGENKQPNDDDVSEIDAKIMLNVEESLIEAIHNTSHKDKIVVFGSFYTVGEALAFIDPHFANGKAKA